ncbi:MAG: hypothetical protein IPG59_22910 [Candidatus Melainabacteria bacterium]|nr:MAG: hypothetical protein IPG59_22910 [Candidatus Melainabacteria bacterium]
MQIEVHIPKIITVVDSHNVEVTFDTLAGRRVCNYKASKIEPGQSAISDCSDAEYWNLTNPIDELREFDKSIGAVFYLNSFDPIHAPVKIQSIQIIEESDVSPHFEILFAPPNMSVICSMDDEGNLSVHSKQSLPEFYCNADAMRALKNVLLKFRTAYLNCSKRI